MSEQPNTPEHCDHHWHSNLQPESVGLRWTMQCSQCGDFNTQDLQEQIAQIRREAKAEALKDLADNHTTRIQDILGYKVQAVFTETIWEKLDEMETNYD